ncbi:MAG: serine O-acetyltransferase EpsC [Fimbriimonadaceae bacterium]
MEPRSHPYEALVERKGAEQATACFPPQTRPKAAAIGESTLALLFPHLANALGGDDAHLVAQAEALRNAVIEYQELLAPIYPTPNADTADAFLGRLADVYSLLRDDAEATFRGDPAAESVDEVILAYPGFRAIATFRAAHELYLLGMPILPRLLSEWAHSLTGVDIHPGATVGRNFMIDHGTGVVIGETCKIGNGVKIYQGVTLGALAVSRELRGKKRHPTVEDNVVIYAHATILGGETVIGHDSVIGGNAWITESIPPFSIVNRQSELISRQTRRGADSVDFHI